MTQTKKKLSILNKTAVADESFKTVNTLNQYEKNNAKIYSSEFFPPELANTIATASQAPKYPPILNSKRKFNIQLHLRTLHVLGPLGEVHCTLAY